MNSEPIFITTEKGQKTRILVPSDVDAILSVIKKDHLRVLFSVCFRLGLRYIEGCKLYNHPEWVIEGGNQIYLDKVVQDGVKRAAPARYIQIPSQVREDLACFFKNQQPPSPQNWNKDLKRFAHLAGIGGDEGISPKMTRASIEAWLLAAEVPESWICLRQGHDKLTSLNPYRDIKFSDTDLAAIKQRVAEMGT
jgi:integrase